MPGNRALIVESPGNHRRYRVNFQVPCFGLQYHLGLRFKTFGTSNLSCVERGDQVLMRDVGGPGFCMIQSVRVPDPGHGPGRCRGQGGQGCALTDSPDRGRP